MSYRTYFNRFWAILTVFWIGGGLMLPFYTRHRDIAGVRAEAQETYKVCLVQPGTTPADCAVDREAYTRLNEGFVAPSDENVYQTFAGKTAGEILTLMTILCLGPPAVGYLILRVVLELGARMAGVRPRSLQAMAS